MAKRKRLTPPNSDYLDTVTTESESKPLGFPATPAPIAQVAGEASMAAALDQISGEMKRARDEGRMIQAIALDQIDAAYIERDRIQADDGQMQELITSIRERGQQTPIEVIQLEQGRYGLISGWRRVTALRQLHGETGDPRFSTVQAIQRRPDSASDAYVAMVEENELRVGLSYYERARIAAKAVEHKVYETEKQALLKLFSTASRAKRSKIRSFLPIYHALDGALQFPGAINERLGVRLSHALTDRSDLAEHLRDKLRGKPAETADQERDQLESALADKPEKQTLNKHLDTNSQRPYEAARLPKSNPVSAVDNISVTTGKDRVTLSGPGVTPAFQARLRAWLDQQG